MIQYACYAILLCVGLYILVNEGLSQIELVQYWAYAALAVEIPFLIYFLIIVKRDFTLNFDYKAILKYGIACFIAFGLTHVVMDNFLVYEISVFDFVRIENLSFTGEDKSFDIKSEHGLEFIALKLVILNPRTSMVEFNINQESMELYSDLLENKKYIPYNVLEFESNPKENGDNKPKKRLYREEILWGNYSLSLEQEMEGWVFFQVPKGQQFELLLWKTADIVKITK